MLSLSEVPGPSSDGGARESCVTREPISIFSQIKNVKDEEKKEKLTQLLETLKKNLPEGFKIGAAVSAGDCFFDSVTQGLNELKGKGLITSDEGFNVQSLRRGCKEYAQRELNTSQNSWLNKLLDKKSEKLPEYIPRIEFTAEDIKNTSSGSAVGILNLQNAIWGRPYIEGKILCNEYKVNLCYMEVQDDLIIENGKFYLRLEEDSKAKRGEEISDIILKNVIEADNGNTEQRTIHIVNYKQHFVPLLSDLKEDIEEAIKVSRKEIYGILDNKNSHSLTEDTGSYDLKKMKNSKEAYGKKQEKDSNSKDKASESMKSLKTVGDGNCFFHAVFGNNSSIGYKAEKAQEMRMEWHKFLSQFKSLDDANMPAPLNCEIKTVFNMFLEKPEDLTGRFEKIKELAEQTNKRIDEANSKTKELKEEIVKNFRNDGDFRKVIYPVIERATTQRNERNDDSPGNKKTLLSIEDLLKKENKKRLYDDITEDLESCALIFNPSLSKKEYSNTYNPQIIKDSFVNNKVIYQAYLEAIKGKDYFIFIKEIPMLASLAKIEINVQYKNEGQDVQTKFIPNPQMINSNYERKDALWGDKKREEIYHSGNHFSRFGEVIPEQKGEERTSTKSKNKGSSASDVRLLSKDFKRNLTDNNYRLWLKNYVISYIAEHIYGWTESSNIIFGVEGCGQLLERLDNFKKKGNEDKTLIYIVNKGGDHWVTLVAIHANEQKDVFFYADSFGAGIKGCRVNSLGRGKIDNGAENKASQREVDRNDQNVKQNIDDDVVSVKETIPLKQDINGNILMSLDEFLESKGYSKNNIHSISCKQQDDNYNCGVFALKNAEAILNVVKDGNGDPAKVKGSLERVKKDLESLNTLRGNFAKVLKEISNSTADKEAVKKRFTEKSQNLFSNLGNLLKSNCRMSRLKTIIEKFVKEHTKGNNSLSRLLLGQFLCKSEDRKDTHKLDKYLLLYPENKSVAFLLISYTESLDKVKSMVLNIIEDTEKASKKDNSTLNLIPKIDILLSNSDELAILNLKKEETSGRVNIRKVSMNDIKEGSEVKCVLVDKMVISTDLLGKFTSEIVSRKEVIDKLGEVFSRATRMGSVLMKDPVDCQAVFTGLLVNYCNKVSLSNKEAKLIMSSSIGPDVHIWLNKNTVNSLGYSFVLEQQENGTQAKSSYTSNLRLKNKKRQEDYYAFLSREYEVSFFRSDARGDRTTSHRTTIRKEGTRPVIIINEKDYGCNELHLAVLKNSADHVKELMLANNTYVEGQDNYGNTPLHFAVQKSKSKAYKAFMSCIEKHDQNQKEGYVKRENNQGETPLHLAARSGNEEAVNKLLDLVGEERREDYVKSKSNKGETPLHFAVRSGSTGVVEKLLQYVNDKEGYVKSENTNKCTPLHFAAGSDNVEVVNKLLDLVGEKRREDYVESKNNKGETPLHFAAKGKKSNVEVILSLVRYITEAQKKQKYVTCKNNLEYTPLHLAAGSDNVEVVNKLLDLVGEERREDYVKSKNNKGETPLHFAAGSGNAEVVNKLLDLVGEERREDYVKSKSNKGETPLHFAARSGKIEVVKKLLQYVNDKEGYVKSKNNQGETPLHFAARSGKIEVVKKLLQYVNDKEGYVKSKNNQGETPLHFAAESGNVEVVKKLLQYVNDKEGYVKSKNNQGETPLHFATRSGEIEIVKKLLQYVNDKEGYVKSKNNQGETPLHFAAESGNVEVVKKLLQYVNDKEGYVKSKNNQGETPLHFAAESGNVEVVKGLLKCVVKGEEENYIEFANNDNRNALEVAISYGNSEVFSELLKYIKNSERKQYYNDFKKQVSGSGKRNVYSLDDLQTKGRVEERKKQRNKELITKKTHSHSEAVKDGNNPCSQSEGPTSPYSKKRPRISGGNTQKPPVRKVILDGFLRQNVRIGESIDSHQKEDEIYRQQDSDRKSDSEANDSRSDSIGSQEEKQPASNDMSEESNSNDSNRLGDSAEILINDSNNPEEQESASVGSDESYEQQDSNRKSDSESNDSRSDSKDYQKDEDGFYKLRRIALIRQKEFVKFLFKMYDININSKNVNFKDEHDCILLHYAALRGHKEFVEALLKVDSIGVNSQDAWGCTPLYYATLEGHKEVVEALLKVNVIDVNAKDQCFYTPLYLATKNGFKEIVEILLDKGADVNAKDKEGRTPLRLALANNNWEIVRILLEKDSSVPPIFNALNIEMRSPKTTLNSVALDNQLRRRSASF